MPYEALIVCMSIFAISLVFDSSVGWSVGGGGWGGGGFYLPCGLGWDKLD